MIRNVAIGSQSIGHHEQAARVQQAKNLQNAAATQATDAQKVHDAFTQFVGESFYAQMLKAMRSSLGKPAYFHGGRAEEIFTSQLDQTLAEELADKSSERLIEPLFERQFPWLAAQLRTSEANGQRDQMTEQEEHATHREITR